MNSLKELQTLLGSKRSKQPDLSQIAAALEEVTVALASAEAAFDRAQSDHDAAIVTAVAAGDHDRLSQLQAGVDRARSMVDQLHAAKAAVERRQQSAREAQEAHRLAERWADARTAADERRTALMRLEAALNEAAAAINDANAALARTVDLLPARPHGLPDGWPAHELAILVTAQLCAGTGGAIRSSFPLSPFELAKLPGMVARHDAGTEQLFAPAPKEAAA